MMEREEMNDNNIFGDMFKEGASMLDGLLGALKKELIEKEENTLFIKREKLVKSLIDYAIELGMVENTEDGKDMKDTIHTILIETLKSIEPEIKKYMKILNIMLEEEEEENPKSLDIDLAAKLTDLLKMIM